ncbi:hypothetical protein DB35_00285 [Streptomyces abyssalis]|uniref:Uncharacterized protein n=1 Tax=Streptomyces abyssalis TaxID=933944 RepID=A0A1E7JVC9_9ACTN|nr:hypothetical protein AN215_00265 [Streptomyces abyssalis]OEU95807.1 hypothetical protein DB35_00285 [Streptomyces abyssalis]OEV31398.1 hypothetical protein AN219_05270 [Streptomyces nanshensis]
MEIELEFLARGEVPAHAQHGGAAHESPVEGDAQDAADEFARLQGDEGLAPEEAGPHGSPLGLAGRVVEVHLAHRSDLASAAVEGFASDQAPGIDVVLHGPSKSS